MLRGAATQPDLVSADDVRALASWDPGAPGEAELPFMPARVILQDFTGVPCVVDLAAMRDAIADLGGDPSRINPLVPADLVIDHSVQVDQFGSDAAFLINVEREYERNGERYALLRWAQQAFADFRVVPPGTGIVHQVNLEFLADVVTERNGVLLPDTLVGTDSHTTMINGLGVVGWGVGGIEAEAALLGQPLYQPMPIVVGFRLDGELPPGATATDLVLYVTEMLRAHGVVGKFVEFHGPGLSRLSLADRATISNMSPEFGATATIFPIDDETLRYLRMTGRPDEVIASGRGLRQGPGPVPDRCVAGASLQRVAQPRPRYGRALAGRAEAAAGSRRRSPTCRASFLAAFPNACRGPEPEIGIVEEASEESFPASDAPSYTRDEGTHADDARHRGARPAPVAPAYRAVAVTVRDGGESFELRSGSVVIAAITSCTNTSNPSVMVAAGLLARNAVARGLSTKPWVKTSLAPGSRAVTDYLRRRRASWSRSRRCASTWSGTAARPASGTRGRWPSRSPTPSRRMTSPRWPSSRGTATSRAASIRWREPATWRRLRWSSPSRWRGASTSTSPPSRSGPTPTAAPVMLAEIWPSPEEVARVVTEAVQRRGLHAQLRIGLRRGRAVARPAGAGRRPVCVGPGLDLRGAPALLRRPRRRPGRSG